MQRIVGNAHDGRPQAPAMTAALGDRSAGRGLPEGTRAALEGGLGANLSGIQVHDDERADQLSRSLGTDAFTRGQDIYFRRGAYRPDTSEGRRLVAHEVTHAVQQANAQTLSADSDRGGSPLERDADAQRRPPHHLGAVPRIQRNGRRRRPPPVPQVESEPPEDRLRTGVGKLEEATSRFQQAIDATSEADVYAAGRALLVAWATVESAYNELTPANLRSILENTEDFPERAEINNLYQRARRLVLSRVGLHTYQGLSTLFFHTPEAPAIEGDLGYFIVEQTDLTAWVVKDTADLVSLLGQPELPESEQWRAIGLLRQHQNPWHYSYMTGVVENRGVAGRFSDFTGDPASALSTIRVSQFFMAIRPGMSHTERLGLYQLLVAEGKIRLLQPATPKEIAAELYGDESLWSSVLLPYNQTVVGGAGGDGLIGRGAELVVDPAHISGPFEQAMVQIAAQRREQLLATGNKPFLVPNSRETATPGTRILYYLRTPESLEMPERADWFLEPDSAAVRARGGPARIQFATTFRNGPPRRSSMPGILPDPVSRPTISTPMAAGVSWSTPGNHLVICSATYSDGEVREAEYLQVVMSLEDKTSVEFGKGYEVPGTQQALLERLRAQLETIPADQTERRAELEEQIRSVEERFGEEAGDLRGLRAIYVGQTAEESAPITLPLAVFVGVDPEGRAYPRWRRGVHPYRRPLTHQLKLVDFTLPNKIRTYKAASNDIDAAIAQLLSEFADDAPYPDGNIRAEVTADSFPGTGATPQAYTNETDGGMLIDDLLRALSFVSLAVGVAASLALQPEIAVPAFFIAGALGGAAGAVSLADRLEHGDFEWDLEATMDILDIAGALVTAGLSQTATATVRGVGRATLLQRTAVGIDVAQIAIVSGTHLASIATAVESGDHDRILNALLAAARDGALFVIIHRSAQNLRGARSGVTDPPGGQPRSTMGGINEPPGPRAAGDQPDVYGTTEQPPEPRTQRERQLQSEGWTNEMLAGEMRTPHLTEPGTVPPTSAGTYQEQISTPQEAYRTYDEALAASPGNEVAIYRRLDGPHAGTYTVRVGGQFQVSAPYEGSWETVLHYHPNPENILTYRMPAPTDVHGTMMAAFRRGAPVTEFVEYPLPDGTRGRVAYTVSINPPAVSTEFVRPDGTRVTRTFPSVEAYAKEWGSRTRHVDPDSPEYEWILRDIDDYYRSREGDWSSQAGLRSTMAGTAHGGPPPVGLGPARRRDPSRGARSTGSGYRSMPATGTPDVTVARPAPEGARAGPATPESYGITPALRRQFERMQQLIAPTTPAEEARAFAITELDVRPDVRRRTQTVSGQQFEPQRPVRRASLDDILAHIDQMEAEGALSPEHAARMRMDGGRQLATHAEVQATILTPNRPIVVSRVMCSSCFEFFQAQARFTGQRQIVADPDVIRIFEPDGTIAEISADGTVTEFSLNR
jgi:hypothetical protein